MSSCVIVIPIYRLPTQWEEKSYRQCLSVLGNHSISIFTFSDFDHTIFDKIAAEYSVVIKYEYFEKKYFESVKGYNRLMLMKEFYERYLDYDYMLIYQLDAWVFKDDLDYWCSKEYDYIGAPLFKEIPQYSGNYVKIFDCGGNGGFSLRKIGYCIRVLKLPSFIPFITISDWWNKVMVTDNSFLSKVYLMLKYNSVKGLLTYGMNEDLIYSRWTSFITKNVPVPEVELKFSFEQFPSHLFLINNKELPFGCHAFRKYEYDTFWSSFIK